MSSLSKKAGDFLNIQMGEGRLVLLLLLHSVFLGLPRIFTPTVSKAFFTDETLGYGAQMLPVVYVLAAVLIPVIGWLYLRISRHVPFIALLTGTLVAVSVVELVVRGLFGLYGDQRWPRMVLAVWYEAEWVLLNLVFWGLVSRCLDVRQAKRLTGLVGTGEILSGILCGLSVQWLIGRVGTVNLLYFSALGPFLSLAVLVLLWRLMPEKFQNPEKENERGENRSRTGRGGTTSQVAETRPATAESSIRSLFRNPYIALVFAICAITPIVRSFAENAFLDQTAAVYPSEAQRVAFFGNFFAASAIVTFVSRSLLTGRLINRFGILVGLLALPVAMAVGGLLVMSANALGGSTLAIFGLIAATRLIFDVLVDSTDRPATLILFQPLPGAQRTNAQAASESVVKPVAAGLGGLLLLFLNQVLHFRAVDLCGVMLAILIFWGIYAVLVRREYTRLLSRALTRRNAGDSLMVSDDHSSLRVLELSLQSSRPGEVLYALDRLDELDPQTLDKFSVQLLDHPDPEVRRETLRRLETRGLGSAASAVARKVEQETNPEVQSAALRACAALGDQDLLEKIIPYLEHANPEVRLGAAVGLLRSGGIQGVLLAGADLLERVNSASPSDRLFAARVLGEVGIKDFYRPLQPLLLDSDTEVRREALASAGKLRNPRLWPIVVESLAVPAVRSAAVAALVAGGEFTFEALEATYAAATQREIRSRIIRIIGQIRGPRAIVLLEEKLATASRGEFYDALVSLSLCGYRAQPGHHGAIQKNLHQEMEDAAWCQASLADLSPYGETEADATSPIALVRASLRRNLDQIRRRVFLLLSFLTDANAIFRARDNLQHPQPERRAYALEVVDNLISLELRTILFPLLENLAPEERLERMTRNFPQPRYDVETRLRDILQRAEIWDNPWLQASALYALAHEAILQPETLARLSDFLATAPRGDTLLSETAAWTGQRIEALQRPETDPAAIRAILAEVEDRRRALTIEKVITLRRVSIFSATPEETLANVAGLLSEVRFPAESTVIQQGEIGDCLYVIADGTVGIHINQQFIARLGSGEIVGEFALLDSEPRSASVITEEDCRLYRLDQRTFYDLMAERTEVARGIIQVLCRRLREQLAAVRQRTAAKAAKAHLAPAPALPPTSSIVARAPAVPSAPVSSSQTTGGSSRISVGHLLPIEKVIILKTVSFFEQTPFPILAEIVSILEEVEFVEGERIIEKGEIGNCMFIIISGAVRVHDEDEKTLAVLGDRSVFGELSVLDAEPRTAFVTAVEETRLFRLDQDAFYELMADRSEVAGGIIRVLTQRIRALMQQK